MPNSVARSLKPSATCKQPFAILPSLLPSSSKSYFEGCSFSKLFESRL